MSYQSIISVEDLNQNQSNDNWCIFDCRFLLKDPDDGLKKFQQGHIPGAQFADLDKDLSSQVTKTSGRHPLPDAEEFVNKLRVWGVSNSSQVICYDDMSGAYAARMWWLLKWLGHEDVAVLDGGIDKWIANNYPLEKEVQSKSPGTFEGIPNNEMWVDINIIQRELTTKSIKLLDARSSERFTGVDKETDPVPGHVPGAISLPFAGNLNKQGTFLSADELKQRFANEFSDIQHDKVINMCGSGVTACHNILAMSVAGLPMTRLYVGSWSEWIKDSNRPVSMPDRIEPAKKLIDRTI